MALENFDYYKEEKKGGFIRPKEYVSSIFTIDIDDLVKKGIKALIVDIDDTIMPRSEYKIPFAVYSWVEKVKEKGLKIFLVSNGSRVPRTDYISKSLGINGMALSFKPLPFAFKKAMNAMDAAPEETAVIGDQILTDVIGGNLLGAYTILVKPVAKEVSMIRMPMRFLEDSIINSLDLEINS